MDLCSCSTGTGVIMMLMPSTVTAHGGTMSLLGINYGEWLKNGWDWEDGSGRLSKQKLQQFNHKRGCGFLPLYINREILTGRGYPESLPSELACMDFEKKIASWLSIGDGGSQKVEWRKVEYEHTYKFQPLNPPQADVSKDDYVYESEKRYVNNADKKIFSGGYENGVEMPTLTVRGHFLIVSLTGKCLPPVLMNLVHAAPPAKTIEKIGPLLFRQKQLMPEVQLSHFHL